MSYKDDGNGFVAHVTYDVPRNEVPQSPAKVEQTSSEMEPLYVATNTKTIEEVANVQQVGAVSPTDGETKQAGGEVLELHPQKIYQAVNEYLTPEEESSPIVNTEEDALTYAVDVEDQPSLTAEDIPIVESEYSPKAELESQSDAQEITEAPDQIEIPENYTESVMFFFAETLVNPMDPMEKIIETITETPDSENGTTENGQEITTDNIVLAYDLNIEEYGNEQTGISEAVVTPSINYKVYVY